MASSKRMRAIGEKIQPDNVYHIDEALKLLKEVSSVKFPESVDVAVRLGIPGVRIAAQGGGNPQGQR